MQGILEVCECRSWSGGAYAASAPCLLYHAHHHPALPSACPTHFPHRHRREEFTSALPQVLSTSGRYVCTLTQRIPPRLMAVCQIVTAQGLECTRDWMIPSSLPPHIFTFGFICLRWNETSLMIDDFQVPLTPPTHLVGTLP